MHVRVACETYSSGKCDRQRDGQTTDKVIPMCHYASQATQLFLGCHFVITSTCTNFDDHSSNSSVCIVFTEYNSNNQHVTLTFNTWPWKTPIDVVFSWVKFKGSSSNGSVYMSYWFTKFNNNVHLTLTFDPWPHPFIIPSLTVLAQTVRPVFCLQCM